MYPLTSSLEKVIWSYLNNLTEITNLADIKTEHPNLELLNGKGRIVIKSVGNPGMGLYLTRNISKPLFRFTSYSQNQSIARYLQELLIKHWETWDKATFAMGGQELQLVQLESVVEPCFEPSINLYYASVLYQFHLSNI